MYPSFSLNEYYFIWIFFASLLSKTNLKNFIYYKHPHYMLFNINVKSNNYSLGQRQYNSNPFSRKLNITQENLFPKQ